MSSKPTQVSMDEDIVEDNIPTNIIKSVVKIFVTHCGPWYSQPWEMDVSSSSTSSGFITSTIDREIVCNAHGVVNCTSIRIRKYGESKKYNAKIKYIGHDCDLAILTVLDNKFWRSCTFIEFLNITPSLQDTITVLGYPKGGDDLSVTQGVVSRVGFTNYSHSLMYLLTIQIDAAINDGNSGGPCLDINGKVIGVAFQGINDADNIGYCIPVRVVNHFIKYMKNGNKKYIIPCLPVVYSSIENYSMKQYLKMIKPKNNKTKDDKTKDTEQHDKQEKKQEEKEDYQGVDDDDDEEEEMQGILVDKIYPFTDAANKLKKQDVILEIDGTEIGDDGTISYGKNSRIDLNYIITNKFDGDNVKLKILRNGEIENVDITLKKNNGLCRIHLYNEQVDYFIFGGLVFLPLSRPYLQHKFGDGWNKKSPSTLKYVYYNRLRKFENQQCIILSQVLASDTTCGYHNYKHYILQSICYNDNGNEIEIEIINLKHLSLTVDKLIKNTKNNDNDKELKIDTKFIKFKFESQQIIVLNINEALNATPEILKRHKIEYDRSENLRCIEQEVNDEKMNGINTVKTKNNKIDDENGGKFKKKLENDDNNDENENSDNKSDSKKMELID